MVAVIVSTLLKYSIGLNPILLNHSALWQAIAWGKPDDALVDLTGAVSETVYLKDTEMTKDDKEKLWRRMLTINSYGDFAPLLTAGIKELPNDDKDKVWNPPRRTLTGVFKWGFL